MANLGPEEEQVPLHTREKFAFASIVQVATYTGPRMLLSQWATPGDTNPHAEHALTVTLAAMWRDTERQEEIND